MGDYCHYACVDMQTSLSYCTPADSVRCFALLQTLPRHFTPPLVRSQNGRVEIIPNDQGNRITPSYVSWDSNGERLIGDAAKNQATSNPEQVSTPVYPVPLRTRSLLLTLTHGRRSSISSDSSGATSMTRLFRLIGRYGESRFRWLASRIMTT